MNDLCKHISNHINRDSETLWSHGGLTRHNLELIQSILQDPTRDYNPIENNAPPYNFKKQASETSMSDKPFLPPRNPSLAEFSKPISQGQDSDSPPPFHKQPAKPARPPPPASKPVANDKLSSLYKSEKQATGSGGGSGSGSGNRGSHFKDRIADSAASGLGWGVGMGVARRMI